MVLRLSSVTFLYPDPAPAAAFWAGLLGRTPRSAGDAIVLPGDETQVGLAFVAAARPAGPDALHLHVTSTDERDLRDTIAQALDLGGGHVDVGQLPEEDHVVLEDPAGHAFCVIEPGNGFLAGTGRLGEVACDGGREIGVFWSEALGWPLVWDQDDETAIQSPLGGTKVAWGGAPDVARHGRRPQHLTLSSSDLTADVARLIELGARILDEPSGQGGAVVLTDPEDNDFNVMPI